MEVQYNIDVVDDYTGEVYREGVSAEAALAYINESEWIRSWRSDTQEDVPGSSIDDPVTIRTFWVETTTAAEEQKKREATREFWGY